MKSFDNSDALAHLQQLRSTDCSAFAPSGAQICHCGRLFHHVHTLPTTCFNRFFLRGPWVPEIYHCSHVYLKLEGIAEGPLGLEQSVKNIFEYSNIH